MAPIPKGGGKGGFKIKAGGGGAGCCGDLTPGETAAVVLSCIFGPIILWIIFSCCLLPMCGAVLKVREKKRQKKLQEEAVLGTSVALVEQPPPSDAPAAFGDSFPSQTSASGCYYTPTARILTPVPPAAQEYYPPPYRHPGTTNGWNGSEK